MEDAQKEHTGNKGGKKRKRMKNIHYKIRKQMEFYFGNSNLHKDRFLKKAIDATTDGYIELTTFLTFNKIKALTENVDDLADALSYNTDLLQVNPERTCVKRITPITEPENIDERTVYVEHLPHTADHEWVKKLFSSCGKVSYVSMPRYASTKALKGFAFVEFETIEGAQEACKELNNPPVEIVHQRVGMFPKSSHQLEALKKQLPEEEIKETEKKAMELLTKEEEDTKAEAENSKPDENVPEKHSHTKLKRCRTQSEGSVEKLKSGSDLEVVPAKRKKQEVSFDLPPDADDTEKSGVSGKKRSKKRKNRSKTIDAVPHSEEQDSSINTDMEKSSESLVIPEKRRKIDKSENSEHSSNEKQTDDSDMESGSATEGAKEDGQKTKKRHRKRKPRKEKELPELRVISKKEWLELRTEYLHLQKTSMALMKKSLSKRQKQQLKQKEKEEREAEEKKKGKEIQFVADVIVKVTSTDPIIRKKLKEKLGEDKQIAYIDVLDGTQDGHIRCKDSQSASAISTSDIQGYTFTPVTGEEEKQYWDKLEADRETKRSTKTKNRKRGHQKWLDKAQKVSVEGAERKHVVFDD